MNQESKMKWLEYLGTPDCPCPTEYASLGILHGVSMGKGWVRVSTDPVCPYHGEAVENECA